MTSNYSQYIEKAEKALKTSVIALKFKPDYDEAIENFQKAANNLIGCDKWDEVAPIFERIAECQLALGSDFHSARNLAKAASYYTKSRNSKKATSLYERAGLLYRQTGKNDSAITMYKEAAENMQPLDPLTSAHFFDIGADVAAGESSFNDAANFVLSAANIYAKESQMENAENMLKRNIKFMWQAHSANPGNYAQQCAKSVVSLIILKLLKGDVIAARKVEKESLENCGFKSTEEYYVIAKLLNALETEDGLEALAAISSPIFRQVHHEFAKLVGRIELPKVESKRVSAQLAPNISSGQPHSQAVIPGTVSDGDEEEDIC